ncbi:MAG: DUF4143 domain-containing protein [Bacteroidetes bacterium]|nr:DUF4143 domain-containing protein [Bacteroidota bacterium]
MLGFPADRITAGRLWSMAAHIHGNLVNYSEIGKSLEVSMHTVKKYIGFLEQAFLVRQLQPYSFNIKKRIVKSPKIYIRDTGILHFLLGLSNLNDLFGSPKMGASWEGFMIEQIHGFLPIGRKLFFYRTHDGAELDLVIEKGGKPFAGIEIKYGSDIKLTKGNIMAAEALQTKHNFMITKESEDYLTSAGFRVCGIETFLGKYLPGL